MTNIPRPPLAQLLQGLGQVTADAVIAALIAGVARGENPRVIARDIQAALTSPLYRALTIARTEMLQSLRSSALATYQANSDVVRGWRWQADFSLRTCAACLAMDGTEFGVDESMDSHVNCRCVMIPLTNSWADILGPFGIDTSDIADASPDAGQSGADWFDAQAADVQQQILGPGKLALYQNGDITLDDLVGYASDPQWGKSIYVKSLKQL